MNIMDLIKQKLIGHTNLQPDQILLAGYIGIGYQAVFVIKDDKIVELGAFSYDKYIRNNVESEEDLKRINVFINLCIKKFWGEIEEVPTLYGNVDHLDRVYRV